MWPPHSNSDHQGYYILVGDPYKPSFATVTGRGPHPRYNIFILKKNETKSHQRSNIDVDTVLVDTLTSGAK